MTSRNENEGGHSGSGNHDPEDIQRRLADHDAGIAEILRKLDVITTSLENRPEGRTNRPEGRTNRPRYEEEERPREEPEVENNNGYNRERREGRRRLEIPHFSGVGAHDWLSRVERYFRINQIEPEEKVEAVMVVLEGEALCWFQWWELKNHQPTWIQFRRELLNRFQPETMHNPYGPLYALKQTGTVAEFQVAFERVVGTMRYEDEEVLKGAWLNGLRPSIREEILVNPLYCLHDMINMALKLERRNNAWVEDGLFRSGTRQYDGGSRGSGSK